MPAILLGFFVTITLALVVQAIVVILLFRCLKRSTDPAHPGHKHLTIPPEVLDEVRCCDDSHIGSQAGCSRGSYGRHCISFCHTPRCYQRPKERTTYQLDQAVETATWLNQLLQRLVSDFKSMPDVRAMVVDSMNSEFESFCYKSNVVVRHRNGPTIGLPGGGGS